MPRLLARATGLVPALLLAAGLCIGPESAIAQASWIRIGDPPDPPTFSPAIGAVCDSLGDRLLVFLPKASTLGRPTEGAELWEFPLGEPELGWRLLDAQGEAPLGRHYASTVFDEPGRRMLLYGGWLAFGGAPVSNDVYVLSLEGTPTWSRIATDAGSMRVRLGAFMALDARARRLVVFGGSAMTPVGWLPVQELWTLPLDGPPTWKQLSIEPGPAPGYTNGGFGWDPARSRVIAHGGATPANVPITETWALTVGESTARWDQLATTGPQAPPTSGLALVDVARDRLVLTPDIVATSPPQGYTAYELPLAPGGEWAPVIEGAPFDPLTFELRAIADRRRQRLILLSDGVTQAFSLVDGSGWSRQWPPDPVREPGRTLGQVLVPDALHEAVWSVGGFERAGFNDLWKLDPAGEALWSWYPQSGRVPGEGHTAVLDADTRRLIVTWLKSGEGRVVAIGTEGFPSLSDWTPSGARPEAREL